MKIIVDIPEDIIDTINDDQFISREQLAILQKHIMDGAAYFESAPKADFIISPDYVTELQNNIKELIKQLEELEITQGKWGKWVITEVRCPICLEYFQTDCYSMEELNECPSCGANLRKGDQANE